MTLTERERIRRYWQPWYRRVGKTPNMFRAYYRLFRKEWGVCRSLVAAWRPTWIYIVWRRD